MERAATSRNNPWIQTLWLLGLLGLLVGGFAVYVGYLITSKESSFDPVLGPILIEVGTSLGAAALIAMALGFAVSAHLWEHKNNR